LCKELGVTQSMGAVGTSADNSLAESFNAALKREVLQDNTCWADAVTCGSPEIVEGFLCRFRLGLGFPDLVVDGR